MEPLSDKSETKATNPTETEQKPVEANTDGKVAEQMEQLEVAGQLGRAFNDPKVLEKAKQLAAESVQARVGLNRCLVTQEPDYKKYVGRSPEDFVPTAKMMEVMEIAVSLNSSKISDWMKEAGLSRQAWYQWIRIPGFREWWNTTFTESMKSFVNEWLMIGIKKMRLDFRYWNAMGEKLFGYIPKLQVEKTGSEQDKALTEQLTKLLTNMNQNLPRVAPAGEIIDITPEQAKQLNEGETNGRDTDTSGNDSIKSNNPG